MAASTTFTTRCAWLRPTLAVGIAFAGRAALAQAPAAPAPAASAPSTALAPVTITGRTAPPASVAGWGDTPLEKAPISATSVDAEQARDAGARRLADLTRFDPSVTTAYDAEGYIDYFTVRGFVIDNRFNFRRDGLPINAETSIPLENKARVDILKGLSGLQAGTSAPGGLVDMVVKRPLDAPLRSAYVEWRERGSVVGSVDLSQRFGSGNAFGVRLNAGAEHLDPQVHDATGNRNVVALAGDWRASAATLVEAEVEVSHRSQPSVPGFSMLGETIPAVPDPRINLNNQPWSLPVVFDATTASLRLTQRLNADWRLVVHGLAQRLRTDDRIAFPFGCGSDSAGPGGTTYFDRYCANGNFDLYDFRSENERRHSSTLDVSLHGSAATGTLAHALSVGVQRTLVRNRFQQSAFNFAGTGNVEGTLVVPPAPDLTTPNTDRDERSTELALRDAIALGDSGATAWLGARHTQLARSATPTDGSPGTSFGQSFTTPFVALSQGLGRGQLVYASWGRGVESDVAPNVPLDASATPPVPRYTNAGQALPAAESSQTEIGVKGGDRAGAVERGRVRHPPSALRRHRRVRPRRPARAGSSAISATAAWKAASTGAKRRGACAPARNGCTRASRTRTTRHRTASSRRMSPRSPRGCRATSRSEPWRACACSRRARTRAAAKCCPTTARRSRA